MPRPADTALAALTCRRRQRGAELVPSGPLRSSVGMLRGPALRRGVLTRNGCPQAGGVPEEESPMADSKDVENGAGDTPVNRDGSKSKNPDKRGAKAERTAQESKERQARWQAENDRLAREAEERWARGQAAYEQAEKDAAQRLEREATERKARWQAEDERLGREAEERRAWRIEYERAEREAQARELREAEQHRDHWEAVVSRAETEVQERTLLEGEQRRDRWRGNYEQTLGAAQTGLAQHTRALTDGWQTELERVEREAKER